jgi:DNA integrity scanning protein DisA with diadenylate cyclase activity
VFVQQVICRELASYAGDADSHTIDFFSKWIISLSQKKHGTSLIFLPVTHELEKKLVKSQRVEEESGNFLIGVSPRHDMFLLDCLTQPDGAIIFNTQLIPTHISTILPIDTEIKQRESGGGARHSSVSNFTKAFNCMGIVVSEDGPISIFKNGIRIMKF